MSRKTILEPDPAIAIQNGVISDYVRLCLIEGIKPSDAYKEMLRKLHAFKENNKH